MSALGAAAHDLMLLERWGAGLCFQKLMDQWLKGCGIHVILLLIVALVHPITCSSFDVNIRFTIPPSLKLWSHCIQPSGNVI